MFPTSQAAGFLNQLYLKKNPWSINFICNMQGSTIDLKRVYDSACKLKKIGIRHVQGKNYKKLKKNTRVIRVHEKDEKHFWF